MRVCACVQGETSTVIERHLAVVAYRFSGGPWRNLWIRYGFDPRLDPSSRIYQGIDFRVPTDKVALLNIPDTRVLTATDKPVRLAHTRAPCAATNAKHARMPVPGCTRRTPRAHPASRTSCMSRACRCGTASRCA